MKKEAKKEVVKKTVKKTKAIEVIKPRIIIPKFETVSVGKEKIEIQTIKSDYKQIDNYPAFSKVEILTNVPIPQGHIRAEVLIDYKGMEDDLYKGDIIDLPERRFKTLSNRGLVRESAKSKMPNKQR